MVFEGPFIAHLLEPLTDIDEVDSVWLLWPPSHLVVWSAAASHDAQACLGLVGEVTGQCLQP
jgi:hypothetical protein